MKFIELSNGLISKIDDLDYDIISKYKWDARIQTNSGLYRAKAKINKKEVDMARLILKCPKGMEVDHINGDLLDNRRDNIRICNHSENMRNRKLQKNNTTGYRGVSFIKKEERYVAQIYLNKKKIHLGSFKIAKDAAIAYNEAAIKHYGNFARLNEV